MYPIFLLWKSIQHKILKRQVEDWWHLLPDRKNKVKSPSGVSWRKRPGNSNSSLPKWVLSERLQPKATQARPVHKVQTVLLLYNVLSPHLGVGMRASPSLWKYPLRLFFILLTLCAIIIILLSLPENHNFNSTPSLLFLTQVGLLRLFYSWKKNLTLRTSNDKEKKEN